MVNNKIIQLYKEAWEHHNILILDRIFDDNITYLEKPTNIIVGINSLKNYWIENSKKQRDVIFSPINILNHDNYIIVEWEASFYHLIKLKKAKLYGFMWLTIKNDKIFNFKECFNITYE